MTHNTIDEILKDFVFRYIDWADSNNSEKGNFDPTPHKQALLTAIMAEMPKQKTIVLDRPIGIDDGEQFCVECGQWTYEGEIDCKCMGYNQALSDVSTMLSKMFKE